MHKMAESPEKRKRQDRTLEHLVRHTVLPEFARRRPGRVLLISPEPESFRQLERWDMVTLRCEDGVGDGPVRCETGLLPFSEGSFDTVLLHHFAHDGRESELQEAWRVLCAGGDIFILGTGSLAARALLRRRDNSQPRIRILQVCQQLRRRAFAVEQCAGCGLAGVPVYWERRWQRPALPLADTVMIHGRLRSLRPIVKPLRFGRAQTVGVRSTAADGLLRSAE
jgi:SAM-dependent methyltransferase